MRTRGGGDALADDCRIVIDRQRPARQVALHLVATFALEKLVLRRGFDAFRQNRNPQAPAEPDDRAYDRDRVSVAYIFQKAWRLR